MSLEKQVHTDGQQWVSELLNLMSFPAQVNLEHRVDGLGGNQEDSHALSSGSLPESYWLTIDPKNFTDEQIQTLIGPNGSVLDAIQYLANTILNMGQQPDQQRAYTIELNGYRAHRQAELQAMADEAAEQVRQTGKEFEIKSLSSAERRQVHMFLQSYADLETYSRGREPDRRLVVRQVESPSPDS